MEISSKTVVKKSTKSQLDIIRYFRISYQKSALRLFRRMFQSDEYIFSK